MDVIVDDDESSAVNMLKREAPEGRIRQNSAVT